MGKRSRAEFLASNLPQLQNLIRRDATSYKEEFLMQWRQWESGMKIFGFKPDEERLEFAELITFISHVSYCFPKETKEFPSQLMDLLTKHQTVLAPGIRKAMVQALILLRNKDIVPAMTVPDKELRKLLHSHIVSDIKNSNAKAKNNRLNKSLQNYMYQMLHDPSETAARKSLDVMIDLYKKNVWNDAKTVNVISEACFSDKSKIVATAIRFFLDTNEKKDEDEDEELDIDALKHKAQINKKARSRRNEVDKALASIKRKERQKERAETFNFSALHLINDPQGFTERLFQKLKSATANTSFRFELRVELMNLITRLIGVHKLILLPFHEFIIPYLKPHQREVASILAYVSQSSHELVPPDAIGQVVQAIADNFVWSNAAAEVVTAGLNSLREICSRCPLAMSETLLQSLIEDYKNNREKSTMNAGRALLGLFREVNPLMLKKRDRGKAAAINIKDFHAPQYGAVTVHDFVEGAELLAAKPAKEDGDSDEEDGWEDEEDENTPELTEGNEGWEGWEIASLNSEDKEDLNSEDGEEEENGDEDEEEGEGDGEDKDGEDEDEDDDEDNEDGEKSAKKSAKGAKKRQKIIGPKEAKYIEKYGTASKNVEKDEAVLAEAKALATTKIFTDEDFAQMKELAAQRKAERMAGVKSSRLEDVDDDSDDGDNKTFVDAGMITAGVKKKMTYEERMQSIQAGREGREKYGSRKGFNKEDKGASKTNREKSKSKNIMMMVHKRTVKGKAKRSLREKQKILRAHITKQKKKGH
ncbi:Protein SDA1 [Phlyctochytrium planicorne]|nr:Protein SDA1 [Phlyctochytrium planicorne]